jgi:hypothetical protein
MREEQGNLPVVVASPTNCRTKEQIEPDEILDFTQVSKKQMFN